MPQQKEIRWSQLKVGLVALASFLLLAITIFLITGQTGFFAETVFLNTYTPDAGGLKTGAVVRLAGVDIGSVSEIRAAGERVEVTMRVRKGVDEFLRAAALVCRHRPEVQVAIAGDMDLDDALVGSGRPLQPADPFSTGARSDPGIAPRNSTYP